MRHAFTTLKTTLAFYLLALLFPLGIYYTQYAAEKSQDDFAYLAHLGTVQKMLHHMTREQSENSRSSIVEQVDIALSRAKADSMLPDTGLDRLEACWNAYKQSPSEPPYGCWKQAADTYDAALQGVSKHQDRRFEGLFLTLLASMIVTIAVIYIIRSQMKLQLDRASMYDRATRLFNRNYFDAEAPKVISLSNRQGHALSLLAVSLDSYDALTSGVLSDRGNALLSEFGALVKGSIRESDIACRYDDNLFLIITPESNAEQASVLASRLKERSEGTDQFSVSIGVGQYVQGETIEPFLQRAQNAMQH